MPGFQRVWHLLQLYTKLLAFNLARTIMPSDCKASWPQNVKEYRVTSQSDLNGINFEVKAKKKFLYCWATKMWMCASTLEWNPLERITLHMNQEVLASTVFEVTKLIFCCDGICFYLENSWQALQFLPCQWRPGNLKEKNLVWHIIKVFFSRPYIQGICMLVTLVPNSLRFERNKCRWFNSI